VSDRAREFHQLYATLRIEDQLAFYRSRAAEYRTAHRQAVVVRNSLLFAAAVAGAAGQVASGTARAAWSVVAAVLAALAAAVTAYEALIGYPQLEKLYSDAVRNLEEAAIDWRAADPGADLASDLERVEGIFRSEIGQWGQLVVKAGAPPSPPAATDGEPSSDRRSASDQPAAG
jgi:conflict system pore-forming effector with SLATT domain